MTALALEGRNYISVVTTAWVISITGEIPVPYNKTDVDEKS